MRALVRQAMEEGALGIGSSLIYAPAFYADTDELVARVSGVLDGGASALQYRNKTADAALTEARFKAAWARADVTLRASRFGR